MSTALETGSTTRSDAHAVTLSAVPASEATDPAIQAPGPRRLRIPRVHTAVPLLVGLIGLGAAATAMYASERLAVTLAMGSVLLLLATAVLALARAVVGVASLLAPLVGRERHGTALQTWAATVGNLAMAAFGAAVAYFATVGFARGRQIRRFGRVLLPGLRPAGDWTGAAVRVGGDTPVPIGVAEQWRENGKTEHASVAAFARLSLDLMALGAPPHLLAAANRDALDEIRHAELCFSLAASLDGRQVGPAPFPQVQVRGGVPRLRSAALARLAVSSLVDGALHEGVSARIIAKLAARAASPAIRAALKEIAADEGRHAAHGWAVVAWCLAEGGDAVGAALLGAARALPGTMASTRPAPAAAGSWEPWGIHGQELEAGEYQAALAHVTQRVAALVAADVASRPAA